MFVARVQYPIVLVGNKYDLNGIRDVDANQVQLWAQPLNSESLTVLLFCNNKNCSVRSFETSVQSRDSLREPFTYIAWSMANPGMLLLQVMHTLCWECVRC